MSICHTITSITALLEPIKSSESFRCIHALFATYSANNLLFVNAITNSYSLKQVKEKTIAARRSGVKTIIFPSANRRDFDELASNVKEGLEVHFVDRYNEIYNIAFTSDPKTQKI